MLPLARVIVSDRCRMDASMRGFSFLLNLSPLPPPRHGHSDRFHQRHRLKHELSFNGWRHIVSYDVGVGGKNVTLIAHVGKKRSSQFTANNKLVQSKEVGEHKGRTGLRMNTIIRGRSSSMKDTFHKELYN